MRTKSLINHISLDCNIRWRWQKWHAQSWIFQWNMKIDDEPIPNVTKIYAFDPILFLDLYRYSVAVNNKLNFFTHWTYYQTTLINYISLFIYFNNGVNWWRIFIFIVYKFRVLVFWYKNLTEYKIIYRSSMSISFVLCRFIPFHIYWCILN